MDIKDSVTLLSEPDDINRTIWVIGGGKGGTGKSFFSANLAIHLSQSGEEVLLIDADLAGPKLHTFLGIKETNVDLGHFITNKVKDLKDTQIPTPYERLNAYQAHQSI